MAEPTRKAHDMPKVQDPLLEQTKTEARFWAKVSKTEGCWLWTGCINDGYGQFRLGGATRCYAHRYSYGLLVGQVPPGLCLDHLCRNRACVKPVHLELVTMRENLLRGQGIPAREAKQTHCLRGHPLYGTNLYRPPDGSRECRTCRKLSRPSARAKP